MKAVLTWHSIDDSGSVISTTRDDLARQLDALQAARVEVLPMEELVRQSDERHAVALTFDDGYSNFASAVVPMLVERRLPATVFVCPGFVGRSNDWDSGSSTIPPLTLMAWNELAALPPALVEIGAHGFNHVSMFGQDRQTLNREITACAASITEFTSRSARSFAFPYGDYDTTAVEAVSETFLLGCTTRFAIVTGNDSPFTLPRLDAYYFRDNGELRHFGTRRFARYVKLRAAGRTARSTFQLTSRRKRG